MHPFQPRYLLPETFATLERLIRTRPVLCTAILVGTFLIVLAILRKVFGRVSADLVIFAVIVYALVTLFGSAAYTLVHLGGFHFGG
jgi:hypothetical protein